MVIFFFFLLIIAAVFSYINIIKASVLFKKSIKEYGDGLKINLSDIEELKDKLIEVNNGSISSIAINAEREAVVTDTCGKHVFYLENGTVKAYYPMITVRFSAFGKLIERFTIAKKLREVNEINNIFRMLENTLSPNSNGVTADNLPKIEKLAKNIKFSLLTMVVSAIILIFAISLSSGDSINYTETIRNADLADTGYTYEEAYDSFFENPKWNHFTSDDEKEVVQFSGDCEYSEEYGTVTVQFVITNEDEESVEWEVTYFAFNEEILTVGDYYSLLDSMIENLS